MSVLISIVAVGLLLMATGVARMWLTRRRVKRSVRSRLADPTRVEAVREADRVVLPPDAMLNSICERIADTIGTDAAFFTVVDRTRVYVKAWVGIHPTNPWVMPKGNQIEASVCTYVAAHDEALVISHTRDHPLLERCLVLDKVGAYIGVPVHFQGFAVGSLGTFDPEPHVWRDSDLEVLRVEVAGLEAEIARRSVT